MKEIKNKILNIAIDVIVALMLFITAVAGIVFLTSLCLIDSESWIPLIACGISFAWLMFFFWLAGVLEG